MNKWIKCGYRSEDGLWRLRGITMSKAGVGHSIWWLYSRGARYTPTGHYEDCVFFNSLKAAKNYVGMLTTADNLKKEQ